ncbi:hypothetical protein JXJ21_19910 [candidate division KSB1 bacterium]|nr:hypothetical protein [candidate division KSB1 bacterium]
MKSRIFFQLLIAGLFVMLIAPNADAQIRRRHPRMRVSNRKPQPTTTLNIQFGNNFKHENFLAGASLGVPVGLFWKISPGFQYYFTEDANRWQFDGDMIFKPTPRGPFFFGGGVAVDYTLPDNSDESFSKVGGNAFLGLDFGGRPKRSMAPFVKARWTIYEDETFFSLLGGLSLALK